MVFVTVMDSLVVVTEGSEEIGQFEPTEDGCLELAVELNERGIEEVLTSSSIDFPEDGGLPGFDARGWLQCALDLA